MVKGNNWGAGDFGSAGGNTLGNGGPNLQLGAGTAGIYLVRANTTPNLYVPTNIPGMSWANVKINTWGIIGSAVPVTGWGSSMPMTFIAAGIKWTITTNLLGGQELKFRANDDWAINLGDDSPRDNKPDYNGGNIPIALDGNYTITLELGVAGNYTYKIVKN